MISVAVSEKNKHAEEIARTVRRAACDNMMDLDSLQVISIEEQSAESIAQSCELFFLEADQDAPRDKIAEMRRLNQQAHFVLICHPGVDLLSWVKPDIRPSALESYPISAAKSREILREIAALQEQSSGRKFCIRRGGSEKYVDLEKILCFEARAKKMVLCTYGQEIEFYSSFKELETQLDEGFFRCHKGYLINIKKIREVDYTNMVILMDDNSLIPLSRTAKQELRQMLEGRR